MTDIKPLKIPVDHTDHGSLMWLAGVPGLRHMSKRPFEVRLHLPVAVLTLRERLDRWEALNGLWLWSPGCEASVLWCRPNGNEWWRRMFISPLFAVCSAVHDARQWLWYRFTRAGLERHLIFTGLRPCWNEPDDLLLHGAMAVLRRYLDDCATTGVHDPGDEARAIWKWWSVERPFDRQRHDDLLLAVYGDRRMELGFKKTENPALEEIVLPEVPDDLKAAHDEAHRLDDKITRDEQDYLRRLVELRPSMWT